MTEFVTFRIYTSHFGHRLCHSFSNGVADHNDAVDKEHCHGTLPLILLRVSTVDHGRRGRRFPPRVLCLPCLVVLYSSVSDASNLDCHCIFLAFQQFHIHGLAHEMVRCSCFMTLHHLSGRGRSYKVRRTEQRVHDASSPAEARGIICREALALAFARSSVLGVQYMAIVTVGFAARNADLQLMR